MTESNPTPSTPTPVPNPPPLKLGGRSVTAFSAAGNSVQLESPKTEAESALLQMQINAIHRGIVFTNAFNPGPRQ